MFHGSKGGVESWRIGRGEGGEGEAALRFDEVWGVGSDLGEEGGAEFSSLDVRYARGSFYLGGNGKRDGGESV